MFLDDSRRIASLNKVVGRDSSNSLENLKHFRHPNAPLVLVFPSYNYSFKNLAS